MGVKSFTLLVFSLAVVACAAKDTTTAQVQLDDSAWI